MTKNIFIEGLQGTGKSTLLTKLSRKYPRYHTYREGDLSPAELAWCSYMTKEQWEQIIRTYAHVEREIKEKTMVENGKYITAYTQILAENRAFYTDMEQYEIYNGRVEFSDFRKIILGRYDRLPEENSLFECSLFQNSIETMMLFYQMTNEEILEFYRESYSILKGKNSFLIYLDSPCIRENLLQIKRERCDSRGNEIWYPLMINYLSESPYGKKNNCKEFEDLAAHLERRRSLELQIIQKIWKENAVIMKAKEYDDTQLPV